MGQRESFTASDIGKINRMYKCNRKPWLGLGLGSGGNEPVTFPATPIQHSTTQRPYSQFGSIPSGTHAAGSREDRNPLREIFKAYTSPQFWQRLFNAWIFSQPQPRHQPQQTYSDLPYQNYPYYFNQGYYG